MTTTVKCDTIKRTRSIVARKEKEENYGKENND